MSTLTSICAEGDLDHCPCLPADRRLN